MKCKINYTVEVDVEKELKEEGFEVTKGILEKFKTNFSNLQEELKECLDEIVPCKDEQSTLIIEFIEDEETINE